MVDTAASMRSERATVPLQGNLRPDSVEFIVEDASEAQLADYAGLAAAGIAAPAQTAEWIAAWVRNVAPDSVMATARVDGQPVWALALEVEMSGPLRIARFMGGKHANGNFPAGSPDWLAGVAVHHVSGLCAAIRRKRPDIDLLRLERLASEIGGVPNPLLLLDHAASPNIALAVDLSGGFDAALERSNARHKRKRHRSQARKLEAAGGSRRVEATSPQAVDRLLDAFFTMKAHRFRKLGVPNVFGDPSVRAFFRDVFRSRLADGRGFVLHGLEVDGTLRAVTGSSLCGDRLICEFGAIAEDELAHASPGDFLFFQNIREAAERGLALYDFSVGDEPYKRLWCDIEITHYDVLVPLSFKGHASRWMLRAADAAKGFVKKNPALWHAVKQLRRGSAGSLDSERRTDRSGS